MSVLSADRRRRRRLRRLRREREGHPRGPAVRSVLDGKVPVGLQVEIALIAFGHWKDEADLRADADGAPLEGAELRARSGIGRELLKEITDQPDLHILADELGRAPVQVK